MHILGAIALMGGTIFMRFALRPAIIQMQPEARAALHDEVRRRWSKVVMLATLFLLASGLTNLATTGRFNFDPVLGMPKGYQMLVGIKFLLALPIFFIAAAFLGRSNMAKRMQQNAEFWMNINLALALVMVLMGGYLRFVTREPKASQTRVTAAVAQLDENASKKLPFPAPTE